MNTKRRKYLMYSVSNSKEQPNSLLFVRFVAFVPEREAVAVVAQEVCL